jgi:hypothetical protein
MAITSYFVSGPDIPNRRTYDDGRVESSSGSHRDVSLTVDRRGGPGNHIDPQNHTWSKSSRDVTLGSGRYFGGGPSQNYSWSGGWPVTIPTDPWSLFGIDSGALQTAAYNECINKIVDSLRGSTDLSIDAAQISKTMALNKDIGKLLSETTALAVAVDNERRKKGLTGARKFVNPFTQRGPLKAISLASTAWLTYVYGIKPTLSSIYDAVSHCRNHYFNLGYRITKSRSFTEGGTRQLNGYPDGNWNMRLQGQMTQRCRVGVRLKIPDNATTNAARLTSLNPASIAWELVPYSFVVDWAYNIGGYLRGLETAIVYDSYYQGGYITASSFYQVSAQAVCVASNEQGFYTGAFEKRDMNRQNSGSFPTPKPPVWKPQLGSGRLLNAAALLGVFIKR